MGTEFHFCETKGVLDTDGSDSCTIMGMYVMPLNCTLKKKKGRRVWSHKMNPGTLPGLEGEERGSPRSELHL